jgi:hypothetical protein
MRTEAESAEPGVAYPDNPGSNFFFRLLIFLKFGITYRRLMTAISLERSSEAYTKLQKVHHDQFRLLSGEKSLEDLKLKFSHRHFHFMVQGMDFGLNNLNPIELTNCFNDICQCARRHSAEYMRKFRTSVRKVAKQLLADKAATHRRVELS